MSDTAQLREALHSPIWNLLALGPIIEAAQELLTIREAGALIITPDKKLVGRIAEVIYQQVELYGVTYDRVAQAVLDALRDAKPDGDT